MSKPTKTAYQNAANDFVEVLYTLLSPGLENYFEMFVEDSDKETLSRFREIDHSMKDDIAKAVRKSFKKAINEFGGSPEFGIVLVRSKGRACLVSTYSLTISDWSEDHLEIVLSETPI